MEKIQINANKNENSLLKNSIPNFQRPPNILIRIPIELISYLHCPNPTSCKQQNFDAARALCKAVKSENFRFGLWFRPWV